MQTIEEYKEYTKQLEGEVGKWHNAYDALVIERNALVSKLLQYEKTVEISTEDSTKCVALSLKENKPIKITAAHTDYAKRIIPTLPRGWMQQKHSWDACKR